MLNVENKYGKEILKLQSLKLEMFIVLNLVRFQKIIHYLKQEKIILITQVIIIEKRLLIIMSINVQYAAGMKMRIF